MKIVRGIALALLYFAVFFITMVFTTMSLLAGWQFGLGLLGIIWVAYFVCSLLRWKFLSTLVLAAFVGYATGLLRQVDQFTTPEQVFHFRAAIAVACLCGFGVLFCFYRNSARDGVDAGC